MISVIIPVYNAEKTLDRCVQSLLSQTVKEREFIFVNDGSKDQSLSVLRAYAEQHAQITVIDKPNGGVSSARNAGLRAAKGEYVAFCDSDDYYTDNGYLERLCLAMESQPSSDLVISGYTAITNEKQTPVSPASYTETARETAKKYLTYCEPNLIASPWNKLFRKSLISSPFNEGMRFGEDAVFVMQYLCGCEHVTFCEGAGYGYIFENTSTTAEYRKKSYDMTQTNAYHEALRELWQHFLGEEETLSLYIKLRMRALFNISKKIVRQKGLYAFTKENIISLFYDPYLEQSKEKVLAFEPIVPTVRFAHDFLKKKNKSLKLKILFAIARKKKIL